VTICEKTPKESHKERRFYSPDDGVLTSECGFCEEELAHNVIENFHKKMHLGYIHVLVSRIWG